MVVSNLASGFFDFATGGFTKYLRGVGHKVLKIRSHVINTRSPVYQGGKYVGIVGSFLIPVGGEVTAAEEGDEVINLYRVMDEPEMLETERTGLVQGRKFGMTRWCPEENLPRLREWAESTEAERYNYKYLAKIEVLKSGLRGAYIGPDAFGETYYVEELNRILRGVPEFYPLPLR